MASYIDTHRLIVKIQGPLLSTRINFNPNID